MIGSTSAVSSETIAALALLTGLTTVDATTVLAESRGMRGLVADGSTVPMSRGKRSRIAAVSTLVRACATETLAERATIRSPEDVVKLLGPVLRDLKHEEFHLILLDTRSRVIRDEMLTKGVLDMAPVHPREVFRAAMRAAAAGIILVHNHPSGDPTPSAEDRAVTRQLIAAGKMLDLPIYDHVIIAGDRYFGFSTAGLL